MNWKKIFQVILPLMLIIVLAFKANAYVYTDDFKSGHYWKSFPIGMNRFIADQSEGPLLEEVTRLAEEQWENAVGKNLWDFASVTVNTSNQGNHIRWSNNFGADTGYDQTRTLAVTIRYASGTYLERVVIILNGSMPQLKQDWGGTLRKTVLHEMGHVVGLDHSSESSIMAAYISDFSTLQQDDINGINAVVNETLYRQAIGYVAPSSAENKSSNTSILSGCGTIETNDKSGNGPGGFIFSLGIGILCSIVLNRIKYKNRKNFL